MTDRLAATSVSTRRSQARSYDWVEIEYLLERVGETRVNGSFTGLSVKSLPDFFQQLITVRGEKSNAHKHLERYCINNLTKDMTEYSFVWSTQLLKDLQCCSWPLLLPCGKVDSTMASWLKERKSRGRFASARSSWSCSN
jgi:hypothetical protein